MRIILDTCALIYAITADEKLPTSQYGIILNPDNEIYLCEESIREICVKKRINKSTVRISLDEIYTIIDLLGISILSYTKDLYDKFTNLQVKTDHRDPSDAIIISQALLIDAAIITSDRKFAMYKSDGLKLIMLK